MLSAYRNCTKTVLPTLAMAQRCLLRLFQLQMAHYTVYIFCLCKLMGGGGGWGWDFRDVHVVLLLILFRLWQRRNVLSSPLVSKLLMIKKQGGALKPYRTVTGWGAGEIQNESLRASPFIKICQMTSLSARSISLESPFKYIKKTILAGKRSWI